MAYMTRDSDSEYAYRLQMEEALAASLSSQSQRPPSLSPPPIVHTSGVVIAVENDQDEPKPTTAKTSRGYGFDFRRAVGEGNSKGKGTFTSGVVRTDERNPNIGVGNSGNTSGNPNISPSRSQRQPSPPPIVHTSGVVIVVEDEPKPTTAKTSSGFDFRRAVGEGNSKGKATVTTATGVVRTDERKPNTRLGNSRDISGNPNIRHSAAVQSVGEGSLTVHAASGRFDGNVRYRLYFKGLVSEDNGKGKITDVLAGFGVAICDQRDNLLFEMNGPLIGHGVSRQGAELKALIRGLTEASKLGIKHIAFCCDSFPIFQYARGKYVAKQNKTLLLLNDLQSIMGNFLSSQPVLVAGNDVKFAYKLARESILAKVTPHEDPRQAKAARKEECAICFNDIYAERMFSVDKCRHRFCFQCVKQHVEVKLLHGMVPKCPHDGCKTELVIDACGKLLTPKLSQLWQQRLKENAIPVTERVYCPYPRCSALMSKTKIAETAKSLLSVYPKSGVRRCVECRGLFCVDCKVPWHGNLSCTEYKKLHPNPPADDVKLKSLANNKMWRQCGKCQHMIELTQGCNHITCRCGHEFCYNCGGGWNKKTETCVKRCPTWDETYIITRQDPVRANVAPVRANVAPVRANVAPNNYFDDDDEDDFITRQDPVRANLAPNNYFDDDDEDDDNDDEDDYDYDDFLVHFGHAMNDPKPEEPFDPFFDLPDGVIFTPDMLSPKSRRQFYQSDDDDSDDNAPANEFGEDTRNNLETQSDNAMNDPKPEEPFDPFFDLPDGVIFTPDMLSPKSRLQLYQSDDDDSDDNAPANEFGEYYSRKNLEALCANPDEDDEYFGTYGKYTTMYDSDGYELEDYTNPFHPDYPHL